MLALVLGVVITGCGSGKLSNEIQVSLAGGSVTAGATAQLKATRANSDGAIVDVTNSVKWVSSQTGVATINQQGVLSSLTTGTTLIIATVDTASGSLTVAVGSPALTALSVTPQNVSVPSGYTQQFVAMGTYANAAKADASSSVQWSVAPATIASINQNGLLLAKSDGAFTVTATSGSVTASANGTVTNAVLASLAVTPAGSSLQEGKTLQFAATATFSDQTTHDVSSSAVWSSSNTDLLKLSSTGLATAQTGVAAGAVTVFAQVGAQIASTTAAVTVGPVAPVNPVGPSGPALTSLVVTPTSSSVAMHTGTQLTATGYYADGSQQDLSSVVTWTTNNAAVSAVNSTGAIAAGTPGASTIQASITAPQVRHGLRSDATTTLQSQSVSLVTPATLVSLRADSSGSSVSPYSAPIGSTQQLALSGTFSDGTKQDLTALATWQSLNPTVATVNAQGGVLGVQVGSAQFTGSFGGQTATTPPLQITNSQLEDVSISTASQTLLLDIAQPIALLGNYTDGSQQDLSANATFQSSNPAIVAVEANGNLIGLTPGSATITGTVQGQSTSIPVAVANVTLQSLAINDNPTTSQFAVNTTKRYRAIGTFSDGSSTDVTDVSIWGSTNPAVFTVDNGGVAHGGSVGTAQITVSLLGVSQTSSPVSVTGATLTGLVVSPAIAVLGTQTQQQFTAVGIFSDGTTEDLRDDVSWTSSNQTALYVDSDGNATGESPGSAQVIATLLNQTASSSSVSVTSAILTSTDISPVNPTIALTSNEQLFLTGTYSDGTFQDLTNCAEWTTSAPNIVYVNNSGLVNGTSPGTATVTALCGSDSVFTTVTVVAKTLTSVAISPSQAQIAVGGSEPFELIGTFSDGSMEEIDEDVHWATSSGLVGSLAGERAIVDGNVIGVTPGNTTISATFGTLTAPPAILHVTSKPLASLLVSPSNPVIAAGATQQFIAQATYTDQTGSDISNLVAWSSSNPSLVSVDANGLATAQANPAGGSATITATTGTFVASTTVQIPADNTDVITALSVVPTSSRIAAGTPEQLVALGTYVDGTTRDISSLASWTSSNPAAATVSSTGLAQGITPGTVTLQAQSGALQSSTTLIVTPATLESVAISPSGATFANGTPQQFQFIGTFSDGTTQVLNSGVNWTSSNPAVASISSTGLAQGTGVGSVELSGTFDGQTATTPPVQVTAATLVSIAVQPNSASFPKGTSQTFHVTGSFSDGTTEDLTSMTTWQSSDPSVVNISASGLGTAVGEGTVQITATAGGISATTASIQSTPPTLTSISITPANPRIAAGTNQQFTAIGTFSDGTTENLTSQVIWASTNPAVATISQYGVAESGAPGSTQFSASYEGVTSTTAVIPVTQAVLTALHVTLTTGTLANGTTEQITATGTFSDGSSEDLTSQVNWSSSNGAVIAINTAGLATAVGTGTAQVTAASGSLVASTGTITVTSATLSSVAVSPATASLSAGSVQQFTLTGTFSDGTTQNLAGSASWSSSNTPVASINAAGQATGASAGTVTITGQSGSASATAQLSVTAATLASITVSPNTASLAKGTTLQFTAIGTYTDGSTQNLTNSVTWLSSDTGTISIGANGVAAGLNIGSAQITAQSGSVYFVSSAISVTAPTLASIAVTPANASIAPSATQQYTATGTYTDGSTTNLTTAVTWTSASNSVATIASNSGLATAVAHGTTTIQAQDGSLTGSVTLTVAATAVTPTGLVVTPSSASIAKGTHQQFTATEQFSDGSTADITSQTTWQSATPSVGTINSGGLAFGVAGGSTQITGTYSSLSGSVTLTVSPATLTSIAVTPQSASIASGTTQQFIATGTLSDGSTENISNSVTWSSSNTSDATINATGLATGVAVGSGITIQAQAGSIQATATLTVSQATVSSLQVQPSSLSLSAGNTQQLLVTATFSDGSSQNVTQSSTYASSATSKATVSAGGLVTAVAQGTATITVSLGSATPVTLPVAVSSATLNSITVTPANLSLAAGSSQQLTATGNYSDGSTANLTNSVAWSSSSASILTVSSTGLVTTQEAGNANVTATLNSVTGTLPVTVTSAVIRTIAVTPSNTTLAVGQTQQYTAIATLSDGTQQTVTASAHWSVSDSTRASISNSSGQNGLLTSTGAGVDTVSAAVGAVSGSASLTVTSATLTAIGISPAPFTLAEGTTQQLTVTGLYSDGSSQTITNLATYTSNAASTASVSSTGLVTATGQTGVATITASVGSQSSSVLVSAVPGILVAVAVTPATTTIANGLTQQFTATGTYAGNQQDITSEVQWSSSNAAVATINTAGLAKAVGPGSTTITASGTGGVNNTPVTGSTTLTVGSGVLQSITVTSGQNSFALGQQVQLTATGNYSDGTTQNLTNSVTWTSLNTSVGVVSRLGVASGVTAGVFGAQATLGSLSASTPLTVTNAVLLSIALTPAGKTILLNGTQQYTATGTFSDGTTQVLTTGVHWTVTNNAIGVASITQTGLLTTSLVGTGSVTATYATITGSTTFAVIL